MPPSKKRRVLDITNPSEDTGTFHEFTVYPCQTSLANGPQTLAPIARFSRSFLPLSWLNGCPSQSRRVSPGSLFYANISCLEKGLYCDPESIVLGVRLRITGNDGADGELYVVERMKRGVYSITPLHSWVGIEDLLTISRNWHNGGDEARLSVGLGVHALGDDVNDWLERAMITDFVGSGKGKKLNTQPSMAGAVEVRSASRGGKVGVGRNAKTVIATDDGSVFEDNYTPAIPEARDTSLPRVPVHGAANGEQVISEVSVDGMQPDLLAMPQDLEGVLDSLRIQYLETLYISKTSVAYFAKGPLSRARATFRSNSEDSTLQPAALYNFLNESIMSVKKLDSKYRDTLPKMAREISRDIFGATPEKPKTKRKSKRYKLGKNGMYSDEKDFVSKWCEGTIQTEESPQQSALPDLGRLIGELRLREMQLQILLVLEALALEESPGVKAQVEESKGPKKKKSKSQELNTTLELLIDRLCIWHTVTFSDMLSDSIPYGREEKHNSEKPATNDKLRDFCTEVIMPFYSSRLPDQCQTINRKFGGPVLNSPVRKSQSATKTAVEDRNRASEKTNSQRSRGPLKRVRTDEQVSTTDKPPSFSRSKTAPSIKATNEPGLGPGESKSILSSSVLNDKGRVRKTKRVDNREVDLDAVAKQHEAKLEKMRLLMDQKKELDAAIQALKKPNREVVSREFVDSAEKRSSWAGRSSRKAKNPTRIPPGQNVQVMATPKGPRTKDCSEVGGSSLSSLPSHWQRNKEVPKQEEVVDFVQDTPLKPTAQKLGGGGGGGSRFGKSRGESTSNSAPEMVLATPQRPRAVLDNIHEESQSPLAFSKSITNGSRAKQGRDSAWPSTIQETPPRKRQASIPCTPVRRNMDTTTMVADSVLKPKPTSSVGARGGVDSTPKKSIYDYLGWDASDGDGDGDVYDDNDDDDDNDELAF